MLISDTVRLLSMESRLCSTDAALRDTKQHHRRRWKHGHVRDGHPRGDSGRQSRTSMGRAGRGHCACLRVLSHPFRSASCSLLSTVRVATDDEGPAYEHGPGSTSVATLSFCSFLTGMGSCTAFSAAIKTGSALSSLLPSMRTAVRRTQS